MPLNLEVRTVVDAEMVKFAHIKYIIASIKIGINNAAFLQFYLQIFPNVDYFGKSADANGESSKRQYFDEHLLIPLWVRWPFRQ